MTHEDSLTYKIGAWFLKIGASIILLMFGIAILRMAYELVVFIVTTGGPKAWVTGVLAVAGLLLVAGSLMVIRPPKPSIHRTPGEY